MVIIQQMNLMPPPQQQLQGYLKANHGKDIFFMFCLKLHVITNYISFKVINVSLKIHAPVNSTLSKVDMHR